MQRAGVRRPRAEPVSTGMSRPHVTTRGRRQAPPCGCEGGREGGRSWEGGVRTEEPAWWSPQSVQTQEFAEMPKEG